MKPLWITVAVLVIIAGGAFLLVHFAFPSAGEPLAPGSPSLPASPAAKTTATYYCSSDKTMQATFGEGTLALTLSDGRTFTLPQVMSGSGIRYEATSTIYHTDVAFVGKGDNAFVSEGAATIYADCTAAHVTDSDVPGYTAYADQGNTFSFTLPSAFKVVGSAIGFAPGWSAPESTSGMLLAKIVVPQSYAPKTNFDDASFTIGTSVDSAALATCLGGPPGATATTTVTIGMTKFTKLTFKDAAAGNRYDTTSYRTIRGGQCYAVEYTIHYGTIQNYPKGTVKAFDEAALTSSLDEVARSFQFLK